MLALIDRHALSLLAALCLIHGLAMAPPAGGLGASGLLRPAVAVVVGVLVLRASDAQTPAVQIPWPWLIVPVLLLWWPSRVAPWLALSAVAAVGWRGAPSIWALALGLAGRELIAGVGLKLGATWFLAFDAQLAAALTHLPGLTTASAFGNVLSTPLSTGATHRVVVLIDCAGLGVVSIGVLAWMAGVCLAGRRTTARLACIVALSLLTLNSARIAAMTQGPSAWESAHHGAGASLVLVLELAVIAAAVLRAPR